MINKKQNTEDKFRLVSEKGGYQLYLASPLFSESLMPALPSSNKIKIVATSAIVKEGVIGARNFWINYLNYFNGFGKELEEVIANFEVIREKEGPMSCVKETERKRLIEIGAMYPDRNVGAVCGKAPFFYLPCQLINNFVTGLPNGLMEERNRYRRISNGIQSWDYLGLTGSATYLRAKKGEIPLEHIAREMNENYPGNLTTEEVKLIVDYSFDFLSHEITGHKNMDKIIKYLKSRKEK